MGRWSGETADRRGRDPFPTLCLFYFLVFVLGYQLLPVVPLHLRSLGATLGESGRFTAAFTLGSALGALFTGSLGDRLGQRRVLLGSCVLSVVFLMAYTVLRSPWTFLPLAFLHGLVWSGLRTASVAKAGTLLTPERRAEGMSLFGLSSPGGVAVGPFLGLSLWPLLGFPGLMVGLALGFLGLTLLARTLPPEPPTSLRRGPASLWPEPVVVLPALIVLILGISYGPIPPFAVQEARHLGLVWPSALLTTLALGMVGLRLLLALRGMGSHPLRNLLPLLALTTLGMGLLALLPGGTLRHVLGGALYGAGFAMSHTLLFMVILERCHPERRGAGVGVLYFSYDVGQAVGAVVLGNLMERGGALWGPGVGYRLGWGGAALGLGLSLLLARGIRR